MIPIFRHKFCLAWKFEKGCVLWITILFLTKLWSLFSDDEWCDDITSMTNFVKSEEEIEDLNEFKLEYLMNKEANRRSNENLSGKVHNYNVVNIAWKWIEMNRGGGGGESADQISTARCSVWDHSRIQISKKNSYDNTGIHKKALSWIYLFEILKL